jgi:hypothetical protein
MNKVRLPTQAALWKNPKNNEDYVLLKATSKKNEFLLSQLFSTKKEWELRNKREFFLTVTLELPYQRRTFKQNAAVWKLVTAIFESMEGRLPDEEEKYNMYLDLLEVYADRVPNKISGGTRPVHISESNSLEGSNFIDGLLYHLATECALSYGVQTTVQEVLEEWEAWRGGLETDYTDYTDREQTKMLTEEEWREKHVYSEASGRGGPIERAHIVSRGADAADIEMSWNWIALTPDEHAEQHRRGWDEFLRIYPHLRGRVERARRLAGKMELEFKRSQKAIEYQTKNLALAALEEDSGDS